MPITNIGLPTSFVPTSITGCSLWMDGADPAGTGTPPATGSTVTTWVDKSSNTSSTPTFSGTATYNNGVVFSSSSVSGTFISAPANAIYTSFTVMSAVTSTNGVFTLRNPGNNDEIRACCIIGGTNAFETANAPGGSWATILYNSTTFPLTNAIATSSNTATSIGITINGNTVSSNVSGTGYTLSTCSTWNISWNTATVSEIILYNSILSVDQRQQVEKYLAWKWKVPSKLPATHIGYRPPPIPLSLVPFPTAIPHTYNNSYIYYTVPANATTTGFYMWGAGGPGGSGGQPGGGGAFLTGTLAAQPGETLRLIVGQGGQYGTATQWSTMTDSQGGGGGGGGLAGQGGQGGGRSAIQKFIGGTWTEIITAGGGGSAGGNAGTYGGNAYYTGTSQSAGTTYGQGRVPTGGSASAGGLNTFTANVGAPWDGTQFTGGMASNAFNVSPVTGACGGGGGGGGYYGGGGGGRSGADTYGGGGGSSYYNATYVTSFSGSNGSGNTAVATNIPGRITGAGMGGAGGSTNSGSNGQVIITHSYAKTLFTFISNFMSTYYNLSGAYALANIANSVSASSATPAYIWTVAVPSNAKGKNGILAIFFNLYSTSAFLVNQSFDYGIYLDGVAQLLGDSTGTLRYVNAAATNYMMSSGGISLGLNGLVNGFPLLLPVSFLASSSQIQIGIKNSSAAMTPIVSIAPHVTSNVLTSSGTLNTGNYVPQNVFTTTTTYTVPTTVQGGTVQGVFVYLWGGGGGVSPLYSYTGGPGGFTTGYYACAAGTTLTINVNVGGGSQAGGGNGGGNGGGYTGVFVTTSITAGNCIAIAGGGGGAGGGFQGSNGSGNGGGGGGLTGNQGYKVSSASYITNTSAGSTLTVVGTQTIGGSTNGGGSSGSQFQGGSASQDGGGGGGGWYGGGGTNGIYGTPIPGGGSGYITGLTSGGSTIGGTTYTSTYVSALASNVLPPNTSSTYYVTGYGHGGGGGGLAVIVPAVGTAATQIGVSAALYSG